MKSDFLISNNDNFFDIFADLIENSVTFDWAVAFANHKAFEKLQSSFDLFFKKGGYSRAVFDITACLTEPEIIEEFLTIPGESFCRIWAGDNKKTLFHHKFYLFEKRDLSHESLIIGSPNFTYNGLSILRGYSFNW